ncbi:DNA-directed RNA polymerase subunit beta' [Solirubrobacter sp. CPCC 204708]|uniref:DNA-directed RNA polymerase subunit beta' n=1 Tax=Solirubrobacter deserti TaxID=2282478 RepID=A0ABT4RM86_9ACTN|nr:DNA-directed RNA polymerase subunit beta' [Solirubrobacter deserti]MBE2318004.1 DNA-directed RNA polymerase subunit beta' [Solirubrobacter deserti]MDA0139683.1 DNA-directed RNA polymerase subunit beta' [Solirubrobacter deserti]
MIDINNFDAIEIGLASSKQIRSWSSGEVTKPETINYRTLKPEKDGLFCERIFGPTKDWECYCGKYKRVRYKGIVCERCGVEVTRSKVRRERMGHIDLAAPVSHIWFFKGVPSRIGYLLDMAPKELEKVLYFAASMVTWVDEDARAADLEELAGKVNESLDEYAAEKNLRLQEIDESLERREEYLRTGSEKDFSDEDILWSEHLDIDVSKLEDDERTKHIKDMRKALEADRTDTEAYIEDAMERLRQVWDLFQDMTPKQVVNDETLFRELKERFGSPYGWGEYFRGGMGAEAVRDLLEQVNLEEERVELEDQVRTAKGQKQQRAVKRLKVVSAFLHSGNKPEMMILEAVPVIPPELRPMVQLDGGRFATSDLNDLYRRVINRNNRLKRLLDLGAPEIIVNNEKRMLQEAVDALFDNGRRGRPVTGPGNRALKSLSDMLKGKQGRFRQNLLGKRVDYSGRSVIVAGPSLRLHQCGLPKLMALELFKPFIMARLVERKAVQNIKAAKKMVDSMIPEVWDVLEEVIHEHPVLLNRAPTLHRLGIQAFEPVLVEGKAIQVHPLVCQAFNADFDGDQMAVHLPLSAEAQAEARVLMLSANNILSPAHGAPLATPTQDMILGTYYLTYGPETDELIKIDPATYEPKVHVFRSAQEAELAYEHNLVQLHDVAQYRPEWADSTHTLTTVGRIIFNDKIERALEETMGEDFDRSQYIFINKSLRKRDTTQFVDDLVQAFGAGAIAQVLDAFKDLGFRFATQAGITISKNDVVVPPSKQDILAKYEQRVSDLQEQYEDGLITQEERHNAVTDQWNAATDEVADAMIAHIETTDQLNSIYMMASSGARGSFKQIRQLAGMRGLMANPKGEIIERPVKANFMEGLDVIEYFTSTHGARKGLADTALRTADSGYLTRRLVDVSQDVIIRIEDCGTEEYLDSPLYKPDGDPNDMLVGRVAAADVKVGKDIVVNKGDEIGRAEFAAIIAGNGDGPGGTVPVRSTLKCEATVGVCQKCYGRAMATGKTAMIGDAVGIVAAQSIGEPGTQLTMRTFHTGGVAGADITHGLPRVVELFEARKPKGLAKIAEVGGTVAVEDTDKARTVVITDDAGEEHRHAFPRRTRLYVSEGEVISAGTQLNEGSLYPHELLELRGRTETEVYLVKEVQEVYKSQGVDIHDKHIELIVRQMLKKVRVEQKGDTDLLPGQFVDRHEFKKINDKVIAAGGEPAMHAEIILGITKASLATDSFLSAASFQETTKVLTDAALEGKIDRLAGLKENVIIGKLIPAATGLKRYRSIEIEPSEPLPRGIDDVGLLDGDDLAAELGLDDGEGLQGFGPAFDTTELDEINAGFGPAGGSFDDIGADLDGGDDR